MKKKISAYEENQVNLFIHNLYLLYGKSIDKYIFLNESWIAYLEGKEKWNFDITDTEYWEYVQETIERRLENLKKIRNNRIRIEANLSLNQKIKETNEEISTVIHGKAGDFANSVILWSYAKQLGEEKYKILKLINGREEDKDIMKIMKLNKDSYEKIRRELKADFQCFLTDS